VQHLSPGFGGHLVDWLGHSSGIPVELATSASRLRPGAAFLAPADAHIVVKMGGRLLVDPERERVDGHRPSGTILFESVATAYGPRAAGIVLTGMGHDGAQGLLKLREAGGLTAAQDHASSAVDGMPRAARELGAAEHVVALDDLSDFVRTLGKGQE
jgi:two-component system chemotaxis response regulator CheB